MREHAGRKQHVIQGANSANKTSEASEGARQRVNDVFLSFARQPFSGPVGNSAMMVRRSALARSTVLNAWPKYVSQTASAFERGRG